MPGTIAPWLQPLNFIGAEEAGARIGLDRSRLASQDLENANRLNLAQQQEADSVGEAGDRLRLAYTQLASNERAATARQNAALALKQQQEQSLDAYRQEMVQNAAERLRRVAIPSNPFSPTSTTVAGQNLIQMSPNRYSFAPQAKLPPAAKDNPADVNQLSAYKSQIIQMSKALNDPSTSDTEKDQLGLSIREAGARMKALGDKIMAARASGGGGASPQPPTAAAGPSLTTGTGTAAVPPISTPSPYKSVNDVRAALKAKKIDRDAAIAILKAQFGYAD